MVKSIAHTNGNGEMVPLDALYQVGVPQEMIDKVVTAAEPILITLEAAAHKHSLSLAALRKWVTRGNIAEKGRERFAAPGGGKLLIDEIELLRYLEAKSLQGGRPRKLS